MDGQAKERVLQDVLTQKQLDYIISRTIKTGSKLLRYELRPAAEEGMTGFLGDHWKVMLVLKEADLVKRINLFIKSVPHVNSPKAKFIDDSNFFRKESLTFSIFEEMPEKEFSGTNPWAIKAVFHNDSILVLPDLSVVGYKGYPATEYLDMDHVLVSLTSLARFHAAIANHQTPMGDDGNKLAAKLGCFIKDPQFIDYPWIRATVKLTSSFLKEFSANVDKYPSNLEKFITKSCIDACDKLREHENTLNVIIHKDLWANNILFKYAGTKPINAVLIDFQCARYAPPAVDVLIFLYYATSRKFRQRYESEVLNHYYSAFSKSLDEATKERLGKMNYDRQAILEWCGRIRSAGMIVPLAVLPFILMSPLAAQKSFDDPQSFEKHFFEDRCGPVLEYARENEDYKARVLEMFEEFVERHLVL